MSESFTIAEWCQRRKISRGMFYKLKAQGLAPKTYNVGTRPFFTEESDRAWLTERESKNRDTEAA